MLSFFFGNSVPPHSFSTPYSWGERVNPTLFFPTLQMGRKSVPHTLFPHLTAGEKEWTPHSFSPPYRWEERVYPLHSFSPSQREKKFRNFTEPIIFILPSAVIYVQDCHLLIEPMCLQEKVKQTDNVVCTFPTLSSLVSEKVDLGLTVYPKHSTLPWC